MSFTSERSRQEPERNKTAFMGKSMHIEDRQLPVKDKSPFHARLRGGWRTGVAWGAFGAVLVLFINVTILIWINSRFPTDENGATTIYKGSCEKKTSIFRWSHILINICSTLLLGASNNGMQCLSAPTRADVDRAHKNNVWLDIGIQSVKNLLYVDRVRRTIWIALLLSSVLLHLFYNSVITASISTNDYMVILATEDFTAGAAFDTSYRSSLVDTMDLQWNPGDGLLTGAQIDYNEIAAMQDNHSNLTRLNNTDCARRYSSGLVNDFGNVILVTNSSDVYSILDIYTYAAAKSPAMSSFCDNEETTTFCLDADVTDKVWTMPYSNLTFPDANLANSTESTNSNVLQNHFKNCTTWTELRNLDTKNGSTGPGDSGGPVYDLTDTTCVLRTPLNASEHSNNTKDYLFPVTNPRIAYVQYCLAQQRTEYCKISSSNLMLSIVIVCNFIKAVSLLAILLLPDFTPIVCIGDAISSFLEQPDPWTLNYNHSIESSKLARTGGLTLPWRLLRSRWFHGANTRQWYQGYLLLGALWVSGLAFLIRICTAGGSGGPLTFGQMRALGFGADSIHSSTITSLTSSFLGEALTVNSPQLLASATYLSYNLLMTSMLMTAECNDFAIHRKALRISKPRGRQRSAYYLQLPYRYAIPLMITCGLLHWLISQSLFLVNLMVQGLDGKSKPADDISACGWSPLALLFALVLGGLMLVTVLLLGLRRYSIEMPIMRSNSLRISAACHPPSSFEGAALWPVEYGVVEMGECGQWRACFTSSRDVVPLSTKVPRN